MTRALPNVLDLPLVSGLVQSSIAAACVPFPLPCFAKQLLQLTVHPLVCRASIYVRPVHRGRRRRQLEKVNFSADLAPSFPCKQCAPKSMTLNIAQMLAGDGVKRETSSIGLFFVVIHHASSLSAQDDNGYSDPYVCLAYAKFGKPAWASRIITEDLDPVWEQHAVLLVSADEVRAGEQLSVQLWDNDKISADDLVGRVNVPITDLMLKPNEMQHRTDKLMGFEDADSMSGTLTWSVGYYEKAKLNPYVLLAFGAAAAAKKAEPSLADLPKSRRLPSLSSC